MIRTYYHHGEDVPASQLSKGQVTGALHDAAGVLWIDIEAASLDEGRRQLAEAASLGSDILDTVASTSEGLHVAGGAVVARAALPGRGGGTAAATLVVGPNFLATVRSAPSPAADALAERLAGDSAPMEGGARLCAARLLDGLSADYAAALRSAAAGRGAAGARQTASLARAATVWARIAERLANDTALPFRETERPALRAAADRFAGLADHAAAAREEQRLHADMASALLLQRTAVLAAATLPALAAMALVAPLAPAPIGAVAAIAAGAVGVLWVRRP